MRLQKLIFLFSFIIFSLLASFLVHTNFAIGAILRPYVVDEKTQVLFGDSVAVMEYRGLENYTKDYVNEYAHFSFTYTHAKCCFASNPPVVYITDVDPRTSSPVVEIKEVAYRFPINSPTDWYLYDIQFDATGYRVTVKQAGATEVFNKRIDVLGMQNSYWVAIANNYPTLQGPSHFSMSFTPIPVYSETEEVIPLCTDDCFSNVLFLPGLMGSKLYGSDENEFWVSTSDSDHTQLLLDNQGKSIDSSIYTRDETGVIDEIFGLNIYKSFIGDLEDWKEEGTISDYALIPYDWRLSLEDIITNGSDADGNVSYTMSQDFSDSFILEKLQELQSSSKSGKVTIITHSNGGLLAKALVQKLKDTNHPLYEKIDKIILVAVPQIGTPDAVLALLHGTELGPYGFIMEKDRARELSENMPTVYNLLPSASYFDTVDPDFASDKLVSFEDTPFFEAQTSEYGVFVSNQTELKDYILGTDGRIKPSFSDTKNPNIGNSTLYENATEMHELLDAWEPHPDTKVIQVAGWGAETIAGLDYKVYRDTAERISYTPRFVIDGDSTVVVPSALWIPGASNVERWWVDLAEFNGNDLFKTKHRDILEIPNLSNFIKSEITDSDFNDPENIVVDNTSTLISDKTRLHFILHSPLTLGITDPEGNYTGMDPDTREIREEIMDVDYRQIGEVQVLSIPAGTPHTLKLQGYADGYFSLDVEEQRGNEIVDSTLFEGIPTSSSTLAVMDIGSDFDVLASQLKVDVDGNETIDQIYPILEIETPPVEAEEETEVPPAEEEEVETSFDQENSENYTSSSGSVAPKVLEPSPTPQVEVQPEVVEPQMETENPNENEMSQEIVKQTEPEQESEEVESQNLGDVEQKEDTLLSASVVNSEVNGNWIWYVIILGVFIVLFLLRRFI